jgi:hypothetical protein
MRQTVIALIAAGSLGQAFAQGGGPQEQFRDQPQAGAYLSYGFGGVPLRDAPAPLHYGFKLDHDSRLREAQPWTPPLFQLDFDNRGQTLASFNGIPFAGRNLRLNQDDGGGSASTTGGSESKGGFTFFDWTLLAIGVGGAGYLIAEATKGHDSPDPPPSNAGGGGGGGTNGLVNTVTGVVTGVVNTVTGVVNTVTGVLTGSTTGFAGQRTVPGVLPFDPPERNDPSYQKWLDGGTGQMGDLGG